MHKVSEMRVKICGLMRRIDVEAAIESGTDAVGFVVGSPSSRRNLSLSTARKLMKLASSFTTRVNVTSSSDLRALNKIWSRLAPDALQLHQHNRVLVQSLRKRHPGVRLILAEAIRDRSSVARAGKTASYSDLVLADSPSTTGMGGTGMTHDWNLTSTLREIIEPRPLILAGGLTPDNVQEAIRKVMPYAVDVSTGVEESIGVKNHVKIKNFIENAKATIP